MLFNSYIFLFGFLPITVLVTYLLIKTYKAAILPWWLLASLTFYGWWNPLYLGLLIASILFNFTLAKFLLKSKKKALLLMGIGVNLGALFYFKYTNFFIQNLSALTNINFNLYNIILPLGISFFSFTQIAFLVDVYKSKVNELKLVDYSLFVTYFPHLIAGPIIHHAEVMPQFKKLIRTKNLPIMRHFIIGISIFAIGLFKKVCIADLLAPRVDVLFEIPSKAYEISMLDSWTGALAYTFQLYFDFSGYSDMAIGLSYMIGIKLPLNFLSPYKAVNIIDFWRRWHMSLSRFFRDYLYIPLGGNRGYAWRKYANLFLVMLVVGLWHGAGWTFILWGVYHGSLLILNHGWVAIKKILPLTLKNIFKIKGLAEVIKFVSTTFTFFCVVLGWVLFRSKDLYTAKSFYAGMLHYHKYFYGSLGLITVLNYVFIGLFILVCALIAFALPANIEFMRPKLTVLNYKQLTAPQTLIWRPNLSYGLVIGMFAYFALASLNHNPSSFLYFNF